MQLEKFSYDNKIVRNFAVATVVWGITGMTVGLLAAIQLFWPFMNFETQYTTFGRIRPIHTNGVIFAFVGNAIFMSVYYSMQRLLKTRMFSDKLSKIHFWGWQAVIVASIITLALGFTTSHEYAEMEWPIDIALVIIWVVFGINMFGTILKRREQHMYVAIWFYIATFVTIAVLYIVNSFQIPVSGWKSYYIYAGIQDALVQWWYGHNAVAFFLTTPFLGMMYYFLPKMANRPVYSYKLSILHFWSLIFIYIWAGPHHLLYTALPEWVQNLGVVFSIMLIAPSWGGMINGLLTLRGAWDKVRKDPKLKFFVVSLTCYGMATFEGPMLSLKSVNAIAHFTDWIIAHVHIGALGFNGFMVFAILYWIIPRLYKTELYSVKLASIHFWLGILGILFYAVPLYWAAVVQGLMWKEFTPEGTLQYGNFLTTVLQILPMYMLRAVGGALYLSGVILMTYNIVKTIRSGKLLANEPAEAMPLQPVVKKERGIHRRLERKPALFMVLALIAILIGGMVEMMPTFMISSNVPTISSVKPYTPLELQGRDIYIREGCMGCHTQMVRPFRSETMRYGEYSKAGEYVYDYPYLWGSKRTGPDLHRLGNKYPNKWHFDHMLDPTITSPGSVMPAYPWLIEQDLDYGSTPSKIRALQKLGVPYPDGYADISIAEARKQADEITADLEDNQVQTSSDKEIIALIAYLQRLGTDIKVQPNDQLNENQGEK